MVNYLWLILATAIGAVLYLMGGEDGYNTKVRDCGVATVGMLVLYFLCHHNNYLLWHILGVVFSGFTMFAALTWSGKKKGQDAKWYNWLLLGFAYGCSVLPYVLSVATVVDFKAFCLRALFLTVMTAVWSECIENPIWEQSGRGALFIVSMVVFI